MPFSRQRLGSAKPSETNQPSPNKTTGPIVFWEVKVIGEAPTQPLSLENFPAQSQRRVRDVSRMRVLTREERVGVFSYPD